MITGGNYTFDKSFSINNIDSAKTTGYFDLSEASEAAAEDAWLHSPTRSMKDLARSYNMAGEDEGQLLDSEALKIKKSTDFYAQYMTMPEEGMTEREYKIKYEAKRAEMLRKNTLMRAPDTVGQFLKTLGVSLGTAMLDPTSIALGYLPGILARGTIGVTTFAKGGVLGKTLNERAVGFDASMEAATAGGRAALRAKAGAAGGAFEGAVSEAPVYIAANERGEKYGASEVFMSLATGIVVGTGIQVTGGALFDVATIESRAFSREKLRVDEELRLQDLADKQSKTEAEQQEMAELELRKQDAVSQMIELNTVPQNLEKFTDPDFTGPIPLKDWEDLLTYQLIKANEPNGITRKLSTYTAEERLALMQSNLSQVILGNHVQGHELAGIFEARRLGEKFLPEDVEAVRLEVIEELKQSELDNFYNQKLSQEQFDSVQQTDNALKSTVAESKKAIAEPTVQTKGLRGDEQKQALKLLADQQARKKEAHATLAKTEDALRKSKVDFDTTVKRTNNTNANLKQLENDEVPLELQSKIDAEVQRRMDIIDEVHLDKPEYNMGRKTDLSQGIKKAFEDMKTKAESPENSRTHRPDAEVQQSTDGRRTTVTEDSAKLEQELGDATENAKKLAESENKEFVLTKEEIDMVNEIEQIKVASEKLSVCMSKAA